MPPPIASDDERGVAEHVGRGPNPSPKAPRRNGYEYRGLLAGSDVERLPLLHWGGPIARSSHDRHFTPARRDIGNVYALGVLVLGDEEAIDAHAHRSHRF